MPFASKSVVRTWLFITVISMVVVCVFGDKRLDLKIGFDIINGENGGPSLRIRDFEDSSDVRPRAKADADDDTGTKPTVRAETSSESGDGGGRDEFKRKSNKHKDSSADKSEDDDDDTSNDNRRSTRGLKQGDYEPEENIKIHNHRDAPSDNDSDR